MRADNKKSGVKVTTTTRRESDKTKDWYLQSTGIRIKRTTRDKLKEIGVFGEDYDDVINKLIKVYDSSRLGHKTANAKT